MSKKGNTSGDSTVTRVRRLLAPVPIEYHFQVHDACYVKVDPEWGIQRRMNNDLHLVLVKSGHGTYILNKTNEVLERGKVVFVSSCFPHSSFQDKNNPPVIIPLRFGLHDNRTGKSVEQPTSPFAFGVFVSDLQRYLYLFEKIFHLHSAGSESWRTGLCSSLIHQIIHELVFEISDKKGAHDQRIENVRNYIANNPACRMSLDDLAQKAELSRKYFTKLFKKQVGMSPGAFCVHSRCRFAQHLLEDTTKSIKEIAASLEYPDQYSFSKQFKQVVGISPAHYRRQRNIPA